ncbi:hypothetical protein NDU88_002019 [Pleurodeles waltl]|uniref:Uncharacterized protein n=1 Tax=Pleurodeles waltl TaxID=8319 RepID=A0AAV7WK73_PLEWA|nr:hypothetical protein NDU88_002019 [Pleurodeles waltl]
MDRRITPSYHCQPSAPHPGAPEARFHGLFRAEGSEICIAVDFAKEINDRRKGIFITSPSSLSIGSKVWPIRNGTYVDCQNGQSKGFYDLEDLLLYLDNMMSMAMELSPQNLPSAVPKDSLDTLSLHTPSEDWSRCSRETHHRVRDLERLSRPHGNRDKVLLAVAHHTQQPDRDKSCSPLKPDARF